MAGIYIHIPFCKQRCAYCDFYSSVKLGNKEQFLKALTLELKQRTSYLAGQQVETIYFGGGTPSLLLVDELKHILETLHEHFEILPDAEVTLEANPDDLILHYIKQIREIGFNRLSVGIQSFNDAHLKFMNRRHNAEQAINAVKQCQDAGFNNLSVDLIYGIPNSSHEDWLRNLDEVSRLNVQHLSAYHLTIEPNTTFGKLLSKKQLVPIEEEASLQQFSTLIQWAQNEGFEHYEISNFSLPGMYSKHNTSYWQQKPYLGLGPSAHSYNGAERSWNVSNNLSYIQSVLDGNLTQEKEQLTEIDKVNELLITSLRTQWGLDLELFKKQYSSSLMDIILKQAEKYRHTKELILENDRLLFSKKGLFVSDAVIADLMILDDDFDE